MARSALRDAYCVDTNGVPFGSSLQCSGLFATQAVQIVFFVVCVRRLFQLIDTQPSRTTVRHGRERSVFYAHMLLSVSATLVSVAATVLSFPIHSTAPLRISGAISSASWWLYSVTLSLESSRSRHVSSSANGLLTAAVSVVACAEIAQLFLWHNGTHRRQVHLVLVLQHARAILTSTIACLALLVAATAQPFEKSKTTARNTKTSPFDRASFLSRVSYHWISPFIRIGKQRRLEVDDVPDLPRQDATATAARRFILALDREIHQNHHNDASFFRVLRQLYGREIAWFALWSTANKLIGLASPLLIKLFLDWAQQHPTPDLSTGYTLAFLMVMRSFVASISGTQYSLAWKRFDLRVRAGLISAIYDRTMRVSARAKHRIGGIGRISNFVSVDVGRLVGMPGTLFDLFLIPLEIVLSLVLLAHEVKYAFIGGVVVLACMLPIQTFLGGKIQAVTTRMLKFRDQRVEKTAESLKAIRTIKLLAWVDVCFDKIGVYRDLEMNQLTIRKYLDAFCVFFWASTPVIVQTSVFVMVVYTGHELTAANAFTAVSLLERLIYPMNYFPWIINGFLEARVSALRLRAFLFPADVAVDCFAPPPLLPSLPPESSPKTNQPTPKPNTVEAKDCSFTWKDTSCEDKSDHDADVASVPLMAEDAASAASFTLTLDQLSLQPDTTYVVCGSVGSGKSSLLLALLGEMPKQSGQLALADRSVAYAPQNPWLLRGTVRDNITMCDPETPSSSQPVDEALYQRILAVCELQKDLQSREPTTSFDRAMVSENGSNFSGGQKIRINLARALYQRAKLYLLDDPLSGLDAKTARAVVQNCFKQRIFPDGATVVVTSHAIQLIDEFPASVQVLVMTDGCIVEQGSYSELKKDPNSSFGRLSLMLQAAVGSSSSSSAELTGSEDSLSLQSASSPKQSDIDDHIDPSTPSTDKEMDEKDENEKDEEEHRESDTVHASVWTRYAAAIGWPLSIAILCAVAIMQVSRNALDWWIAVYTNDTHHHKQQQQTQTHLYQVSPYTFANTLLWITLVNCIAVFVRAFLFAFGGLQAARAIYGDLVSKIFRASLPFFQATPVGRILNRLSGDTYSVDESLPFILNIFLKDFADVVGTLVILFYGNTFVLLLLVPLSVVYFKLQANYRPLSRHLQRLESTAQSPILAMFTETLEGLSVIRAMNLQDQYCATYEKRLNRSQRMSFLGANAGSWFGIRLDMLGVCVTSFVAVFAVVDFQISGRVHPGVLGLTLTYTLPVVSKLNTILGSFVDTERQMIAVERVKEYSELQSEEDTQQVITTTTKNNNNLFLPLSWPSAGEVCVANLSVSYATSSTSSNSKRGNASVRTVNALRAVNFIFQAGEKIGICGRTGAGKSTFMHALFRAVAWQPGSLIQIDGVSIDQVPLQVLRSRLTYVPQDVVLFAGTVRFNLDPEGKVADHELWACLSRSGLDVAVSRLSCGLDAEVGTDETTFSMGQAQLLCIARALLRRSKVLCIDEATSSIDYETEAVITQTLEQDFAESTVIIIAHRLQTITNCDRIFLFDHGKIVESGPPKKLLADPASQFSALARNQNNTAASPKE